MSDHAIQPIRATQSALRGRIDEVFTPSTPVARRDLLAGRQQPIETLLESFTRPGCHIVLFGEAAVGKTSLVNLAAEFSSRPVSTVRVTTEARDTFTSLWRKAADQVRLTLLRAERGLTSSPLSPETLTAAGLPATGELDVHAAISLLARMSNHAPALVVFDDFEKLTDPAARTAMAEVMAGTATQAPLATIVLCGTAQAAEELLSASSAFALHLSRLSPEECMESVLRALRVAGMTPDDSVVERIATLANGMPGYTQQLGLCAARAAAAEQSTHLSDAHLGQAVADTLAQASETIVHAYEQSIVRARRGIYPEILLACALSARDAAGTFAVADVHETLARIVRREVRGLTNQVAALTEEGRGAVLEKKGAAKTARYRFVNPMLEPYILMRGLEPGWVTSRTPVWMPAGTDAAEARRAA